MKVWPRAVGRRVVRLTCSAKQTQWTSVLGAIVSATPARPPGQPLPEIKDIAPPIDVFPYPTWMIVLAALAAAALLGLAVWGLARWLRRRPPQPPPTPQEIAMRELESLRPEVTAMEPYAFSVAVSDVLRRFVSAQYQLAATQQTSPEFLATISNSPRFSPDDRQLLARFLERSDLIKFARVDASSEDSRELLASAVAFVQGGRA